MSKRRRPKPQQAASKLPNAPLAEVVFEVRWQLHGDERAGPFRSDPGYFVCLDGLLQRGKSIGFPENKLIDQANVLAGHSVTYRFYRATGEIFPVLQIGPGIFAVNESTGYTWQSFKTLCVQAFDLLVSCYPKMDAFPLVPVQFELRYIDALKREPAAQNLISFLNDSTHFEFHLPTFLSSDLFGPISDAQFNFTLPAKNLKDTRFSVSLSKGKSSGVDAFIMISKVTSKIQPGYMASARAIMRGRVQEWLDGAHEMTSPFFRSIVKDSLMVEFTEPANA